MTLRELYDGMDTPPMTATLVYDGEDMHKTDYLDNMVENHGDLVVIDTIERRLNNHITILVQKEKKDG